VSARFDEDKKEWEVVVNRRHGETSCCGLKQLVFALGVSGFPNVPQIEGAEDFKGVQHHSSKHPWRRSLRRQEGRGAGCEQFVP
jgi:putative flavoprotein involved in K+ transport